MSGGLPDRFMDCSRRLAHLTSLVLRFRRDSVDILLEHIAISSLQ